MASPTFDSVAIFDSLRADGSTLFSEGVLFVHGYEQITQKLHFNGEDGDRYLFHGWPDREWTYTGLMSADSYTSLATRLAAIQTKIDANTSANTTYKVLVDSFGGTYDKAQIRTLNLLEPPHATIGGYVCRIQVNGIIQGSKTHHDAGS